MFTDGRTDVQNNIIGAANVPKNLPIFKVFIFIVNICNASVKTDINIVFINLRLFSSFHFYLHFLPHLFFFNLQVLIIFHTPSFLYLFSLFVTFVLSSYVSFCVTLAAFSTLIIRRLITKHVLNNIYFVFFLFFTVIRTFQI